MRNSLHIKDTLTTSLIGGIPCFQEGAYLITEDRKLYE